jgi:hypothetical protein
MPLNKGRDITVLRSTDQIALPMPWNSAILDGCRPFTDGHSILNLAIPYSLTANDVIRKPLRFPDFPYNVDITL